MRVAIIAILFALALPGCAYLTVDVDVSPDASEEENQLPSRDFVMALLNDPWFNSAQRVENFAQYKMRLQTRVSDSVYDAFVRNQAAPPNVALQAQLRARANQNASLLGAAAAEAWAPVDTAASAVERTALDALAAIDAGGGRDNGTYRTLLGQIRQYQVARATFEVTMVQAIDNDASPLKGDPTTKAEVIADTKQVGQSEPRIAASAQTRGQVVGYPIFDPKIKNISSKDRQWYDFVDARFSTFGGSAQFVAVREGLVVYRQKSLDFDPTPVVGAGSALTKLGLRVAAAQVTGNALYEAKDAQGKLTTPSSSQLVNRSELRSSEQALRGRHRARMQALHGLADLLRRLETDGGVSADELTAVNQQYAHLIEFYQGQLAATDTATPSDTSESNNE